MWNVFMIVWNSVFLSLASYRLGTLGGQDAFWMAIAIPAFVIGLAFHIACIVRDMP